jgi:hypothetical protein
LKTRSELETNWWWTLLHRPLNMRGEITEQMRHDEFERTPLLNINVKNPRGKFD